MKFRIFFCTVFIFFSFVPTLWAWGERGHDLVTRVAARLLVARYHAPQTFAYPFERRELMLGHLANVPDIIWRDASMGLDVNKANESTHYINIDLFSATPTIASVPVDITEARAVAKSMGKTIESIGTAPWRIGQFYRLMVESFKNVAQQQKADATRFPIDAANEALLYAGLMSHFVADLANPEHVTSDYDGYGKGQGGLHEYFESLAVEALPLNLEYEVFEQAVKVKPLDSRILTRLPKSKSASALSPVAVILALTLDSLSELKELEKADRSCVIKASIAMDKGKPKVPAQRKPVKDCLKAFKPLIVQRLATGADTLAYVWYEAWKQAGSPPLQDYKSYYYPVKPAFVKPDYL